MSYVKIGELLIGNSPKMMFKGISDSASGSAKRREVTFAGEDGADFEDITFEPRSVSVYGFCHGDTISEIASLKESVIKACNSKIATDIIYNNGVKDYYASAYCELPSFSKISNLAYEFVIHFEISKFWWLTGSEIVTGIFARSGNIYGEFTLPRAFTQRINGGDARNTGHAESFPLFAITASESFTDDIIITNTTYGESIKLENYTVSGGESIVIDCDKCTIRSSVNGNIIKYLTEDSKFFSLRMGYNRIECVRKGITISCKWRERFLGV